MMNQMEIEAAGREEYAMWRKSKDRINSITEYVKSTAADELNNFTDAFSSGDTMEMLGYGVGILGSIHPGGRAAGLMTKGAQKVLGQIKFPDKFNIVDYFKPIKSKEQMAAAINTVKHKFTNYDKVINGVPKNDYLGVQEGFYGTLANGLSKSKQAQNSKWADEIYIEKMRGLNVPGF